MATSNIIFCDVTKIGDSALRGVENAVHNLSEGGIHTDVDGDLLSISIDLEDVRHVWKLTASVIGVLDIRGLPWSILVDEHFIETMDMNTRNDRLNRRQ